MDARHCLENDKVVDHTLLEIIQAFAAIGPEIRHSKVNMNGLLRRNVLTRPFCRVRTDPMTEAVT